MKHIWSIICQKSSIDFENNLLSLFNCVEEMNLVVDKDKVSSREKMLIPAEFQLISFWVVEDSSRDNNLEIKGELIDPDNKILNTFNNSFTIKSGASRFRNRTNIQGLPITKAGRYYLKVWQKNNSKADFKLVAELPIDIKINYQLLKVSK
ncbi:hypothetical protein AUJ35_02465 [Candidatus Falkowbacteria bacterium CG1_02_41_21]|uniref:Uncharacterized protein n=1 Tax=Candidatus Falkowbacteria bacterium CG1_02_41_21 TaxID=1805147 RepID=A0A1J4T8K5_9BACT|nr:MAG: hypothetical protein AUJ35_02465 [Candidatus Falkowbacteria bacterium CG1_02_41_21]